MENKKIIGGYPFVKYQACKLAPVELRQRSLNYLHWINSRRSVREFSSKTFPLEVITDIVMAASSAPSGAHKQPWTFCIVSNAELKKQIRLEAEKEEYGSYTSRMNEEWLEALKQLQTDWRKPFLEVAPYLIIVFKKVYDNTPSGERKNYYVNESVGLACGFLLTAIHHAGLVALTHTPSPMNFLTKLLNRPSNERPYLLIPVGYAAEETYVPDLIRKDVDEVAVFYP